MIQSIRGREDKARTASENTNFLRPSLFLKEVNQIMNVTVRIGTAVYLLSDAKLTFKPLKNRNFFLRLFSHIRKDSVETVMKAVTKMSLNRTRL